MITFRQQFDKLTRAYISGQVNPQSPCQCFIGNLLNNNRQWIGFRQGESCSKISAVACVMKEAEGFYTGEEILHLENVFMGTIGYSRCNDIAVRFRAQEPLTPELEEDLFRGFQATLAELERIHISKGEVIDEVPVFVKRQLQVA